MTYINLKEYNVTLQDFEWFFLSIENELINALYDAKLLNDYQLKNVDTKKTFHHILIKNIISKLHGQTDKFVFIIKPEIITANCEIMKYFDKSKIRREFLTLFKFMIKCKFKVFLFLNTSYSNVDNIFNLESPEIRDFLDVHILQSNKRLFSKVDTVNSLTRKITKIIK